MYNEDKEMMGTSTQKLEEELVALRERTLKLEYVLQRRKECVERILLAQQSTDVHHDYDSAAAVQRSVDAQARLVQKHSGEIY